MYSWKTAGVDISYGCATTAAAEAQGLSEAGKTVTEAELQPGDLIFYSYTKNGRFMNISHVGIYAGNGKMVEAANEQILRQAGRDKGEPRGNQRKSNCKRMGDCR